MVIQLKHFKPGEILFREGDPGGDLFFIENGAVEIFHTRNETDVQLNTVGKGELIGTVTLFDASPRTASARAITEVKAQYYDREAVKKSVNNIPEGIRAVIKDILIRLKQTDDKLVKSHLISLKQTRLCENTVLTHAAQAAKLLLWLAGKQGKDAGALCLSPDIDWPPIAFALGMKQEYLEEIMEVFREHCILQDVFTVDEASKETLSFQLQNTAQLEILIPWTARFFDEGRSIMIEDSLFPWVKGLVSAYSNTPLLSWSCEWPEVCEALEKQIKSPLPENLIQLLIKANILQYAGMKANRLTFVSPENIRERVAVEDMARQLLKLKPKLINAETVSA